MKILVDMDGVITDFEKGLLSAYRNRHPSHPFIPLDQRTSYFIKDQYPNEHQPLVEAIYSVAGFFISLPPIDGSFEALLKLASSGAEVFICTSPLLSNPFCIQEKIEWVKQHLGEDWPKRMIITSDKTIVQGDILIDDKPNIQGVQTPTWEHILYSQPYNAHVNSKRRMTWRNWKTVIFDQQLNS